MEKYRINEFASRISKSVQTVPRWEREGKVVARRHVSGHRYFDELDNGERLGGNGGYLQWPILRNAKV